MPNLEVAVRSDIVHDDVIDALRDEGWSLIVCRDGGELLGAVLGRKPRAIVVRLARDTHDLGVLPLVRRYAPNLPLILVAEGGDLELQRELQAMRPYYYDVVPFDPDQLREAVRSAIRPARGLRAGR